MPLDTGRLSDDRGSPYRPNIYSGADVGEALKAIREHYGLSLQELAARTRVRTSYLAAIESMNLEALPSRPFIIGFIRAYATALGVDAEAAAERFKADEPVLDDSLPEPVGVGDERDPRLGAIMAGGFIIVVAIVAWNVAQRVITATAPVSPNASGIVAERALARVTSGPIKLGAPLPPPVESTTPPPYETPGLAKANGADGQPLLPPGALSAPPMDLTLPAVFTPEGAIYGAPANQPGVIILQALKPGFLIVHGTNGSVYFARQLAPGEAFRAPPVAGLTIDVAEPEAFQVFVGGQSKGVLPTSRTDVAALLGG